MGVIVIGSLNMDLVVMMERFPDSGETVNALDFASIPGGKGLNQAIAARRAGAKVSMIGAIGSDDNSRTLENLLHSEGIDSNHLQRYQGSSGVAIVEVEKSGANRIAIVPGANGRLSYQNSTASIFSEHSGSIAIGPLENPIDELEKYFKAAKEAGLTTILNPAPVQLLSQNFLTLIDIFIPNQHEAEDLTGLHIDNLEQAEKAARALLRNGHKAVIVTLGEDGAILATDSEILYQKAFKVNSIDTTAAGDTFCGTFAAELDDGSTFSNALKMAAAAAALSTTKSGAANSIPSRAEVLNFIDS